MRESEIERYLVREVKRKGGLAMKFVSPGLRGVPDRLVIFPGGIHVFVELKAPGEKPSKQQQYRIVQLEKLGCRVRVIDSRQKVDVLIWEMVVD